MTALRLCATLQAVRRAFAVVLTAGGVTAGGGQAGRQLVHTLMTLSGLI